MRKLTKTTWWPVPVLGQDGPVRFVRQPCIFETTIENRDDCCVVKTTVKLCGPAGSGGETEIT